MRDLLIFSFKPVLSADSKETEKKLKLDWNKMTLKMQMLFFLSWCFLVPGCLCAKVKPLKALLIEVGREASPDEMAKKESGEVDYDYEIDEENAKWETNASWTK